MEKKKKKENIEGVTLENEIGQQKSACIVCDSRKSTFLKLITNKTNKIQKWFLQIVKTYDDLSFKL